MKKSMTWIAAFALYLVAASNAFAAQQAVVLKVDGMKNCPSCPYIVKQSLVRIAGVSDVMISYEEQTVIVNFDDGQTDVAAITAATANAGFPSRILQ
jgi:mercuric ion binding protein